MIYSIWAMDENRLIGDANQLPWHIPKDLAFFKRITKDQDVLMGHETYVSLKSYYKTKPLPFRTIYVANLNDETYPDATRVDNIHTFLPDVDFDLYVIGGKTIYELTIPYIDVFYITYILKSYRGNIYIRPFDLSSYTVDWYALEDGLIFTKYVKKVI